jgi:DNA-binding IclR family transcriptional regulator
MADEELTAQEPRSSLLIRKAKKESDPSGIRVISRAAEILKLVGQHPEGLTLREIADRTHLPRSTVQRIVSALDDENFLIPASPTSGVRLGPELISLGALAKHFDIVETLRPLLVQLSKELGETVDLAVMGSEKAVVVDQIPGIHPLMAVSHVGSSLPLHCSASGKALLATLAEEELAKLNRHYRLTPRTRNSILDWNVLMTEVAEIRRRGMAIDREECFSGICAIAVALHAPNGEIAAISMPVPSERFIGTEKTLVRALVERTGAMQSRFLR